MTVSMHEAYLSLGSNTPDRASRMESAIAFVSTIGLDMLVSEIYQTAAVNGRDPDYLNAVVRIHTPLGREEVEALVKSWEKKSGRLPEHKCTGSICIDIDLVIWDGEVLRPTDFYRTYFSRGFEELTDKAYGNPV